MAKVNLTLETLGNLSDGRSQAIINSALKAAVRDLDDRGRDGKPRKVVITVEMVMDDTGELVTTDVRAEAKIPPYRTPATMAGVKVVDGDAALTFQTENRERPDQPTLYNNDDERKSGE